MKYIRVTDKIKIAFSISILFTLGVLITMYANMRKTAAESAAARSALNALSHLENILIKVQAIETGQRGYIISGDTAFLKPYHAALATLDKDIEMLHDPLLAETIKKENLDSLGALVNEKVRYAKLSVETRLVNGYDSAAARVQAGTGRNIMELIMVQLASAEQQERSFLETSNLERAHYTSRLTWLFFILTLLFCITTVGGYFFILNDFKKSEKTNKLLLYNSTLLRNISDAIITTDEKFNITDWNVFAEKLYGYTAEEIKGKNVGDVLKLQFIDTDWAAVQKILNEEESWKGETIHFTKKDERINALASTSALRNEKNELSGTITVVRDISERVRLDEDLRRVTGRLREQLSRKVTELNLFFERIADAFIALDNDWNYTYLNKAALEFHGTGADMLIGKNIWEIFPEVVGEPFYDVLQEAKATQIPQRKELYYSKEDKWYEDLIYPGKDGISVYYRDITEKKKAEEQLQRSEEALKFSNERFELVAKATNDAIWDWDMKTDSLSGNESFCKMFEVEQGKSIRYADFIKKVHPEDLGRIKQNFKETLQRRESLLTEEFRFLGRDGKYKVVYDRAYILYNRENRGYRMLGAMQDVTDIKEAEQKLLLEKELSDSIINSLPGIFYLYNKQGEFYRWNKNFETVTGYSGEEISKMHPLNFFIEEEKTLLIEKIGNVFITGSDNVEALLLTKDGSTIPYYFTGMLINYETEECLMGVGLDISEKIRSQQELVESEEKFRTLVQQASDGITITDEDANFIDVNESFSLMTGYLREELLHMTAYNVFHDEDNMSKPFRYTEMMKGVVILTERVIKKKNGRFVNVEVSGKQLEDGRFQAIIRDITERKEVEEALRVSERKYRLLFNENPLPMWIFSLPDRKFLDVNRAAIISYGYTKEEFLQMHVSDINHEKGREVDLAAAAAAEGMLRHEGAWDHHKKNGTVIKVNIIAHNIIYEGRSAVLVLANDITDKFRAEEELQRSHEELRELASHLETIREAERTHMAREIHDELGQQLTGLKMDISWLGKKIRSEDDAVNEKLKDTIELIDKTVITVRRIATQLRPSILDDLGLVAAMEWQSEEFEKRADIAASFTSNMSHVTVSPEIATGIFRIFQESLTNVLRHSKATEVVSSLHTENDMLTLRIEDNGIGFREEDILHKKTLGLLGMKERVLLINGTYVINGDSGRGTSVIITVPLS